MYSPCRLGEVLSGETVVFALPPQEERNADVVFKHLNYDELLVGW